MTSTNQTIETATSLRRLYFSRAAFAVLWAVLISIFAKTNADLTRILLMIYPLWDAIASYVDIKANTGNTSKTPQYVNLAISGITTIAVVVALNNSVPAAIMVFGAWAILTGLIQLILGIKRRKTLGGQWPMIISGGQSMLGGTVFIIMAHAPNKGIDSLAGYAVFGAFYFLLAAIRLAKTIKTASAV